VIKRYTNVCLAYYVLSKWYMPLVFRYTGIEGATTWQLGPFSAQSSHTPRADWTQHHSIADSCWTTARPKYDWLPTKPVCFASPILIGC